MELYPDAKVLHNEENAAAFVVADHAGPYYLAFTRAGGKGRMVSLRNTENATLEQARRTAICDGAFDIPAMDRAISALSG